nr:ribonuclease H-like domain-containing protein [Tanacetum cinerariifolium]
MEHYLNHTDDLIWRTIQNGNGPVSVITDTNAMIKVLPPKSAKEVVARERERKARTTLLMALPEDHLAKFHKMADAKEMWEAIKSRYDLIASHISFASAILWNFAKWSSGKAISKVINDHDMEEMDLKWQVAMISIRIKKFHKTTGRKLLFDTKDPVGFDKTKVECFNCHKIGHFARDCRTKWNQDNRRRDVGYNGNKAKDNGRRPAYQDDSKALITIDGEDIDWSRHIKEDAQNYAMMAYSSSNSGSDNEASDLEDTSINDRYADGMQTVSLPMTGNYLPSGPDVEINYSKFTYVPKQTSIDESNSKTSKYASCEYDFSVETTTSMPAPVKNAPKVVCEPKVSIDAPIIEEYESDSDNDLVSHDDPLKSLNDKGIIDSGYSRHMTGNKAHITDYQEIKGGFVAFGELKHYNLFSVSQMCEKKNKVLFTDTDCLVLSLDFKLPDENQVLLKIPRQHNMYSFNLKNIDPSGDLACLFAKALIDKSNKWHRRLGHLNFKNLNQLVKGNLVRGLSSKIFENDHTCVACQKGKPHKHFVRLRQ